MPIGDRKGETSGWGKVARESELPAELQDNLPHPTKATPDPDPGRQAGVLPQEQCWGIGTQRQGEPEGYLGWPADLMSRER